MTPELKIVWRGLDPSDALSERIQQHVEALGAEGACRVSIGRPHRHHRHGAPYEVKIALDAPGRATAITRDEGAAAVDAYAAVNAAFAKLRRRLEANTARRRAMHRRAREA